MPSGVCVSSCTSGYAPQTVSLSVLGINVGVCVSISITNSTGTPGSISVTTTVIISFGTSPIVTVVQLQITMRQDLANALGVSLERITMTITLEFSSSLPSSPDDSNGGGSSAMRYRPRTQSTTQAADVQITFGPDNSTDSTQAWESARSLAMLFANQMANNDSIVSRLFRDAGVTFSGSADSLKYVPMFSCQDGSTAASCPEWTTVEPIAPNDNTNHSDNITVSTWYIIPHYSPAVFIFARIDFFVCFFCCPNCVQQQVGDCCISSWCSWCCDNSSMLLSS
jgi:hypothetical protein